MKSKLRRGVLVSAVLAAISCLAAIHWSEASLQSASADDRKPDGGPQLAPVPEDPVTPVPQSEATIASGAATQHSGTLHPMFRVSSARRLSAMCHESGKDLLGWVSVSEVRCSSSGVLRIAANARVYTPRSIEKPEESLVMAVLCNKNGRWGYSLDNLFYCISGLPIVPMPGDGRPERKHQWADNDTPFEGGEYVLEDFYTKFPSLFSK